MYIEEDSVVACQQILNDGQFSRIYCNETVCKDSAEEGSNPVVGITNQKPTVNSAVHPSEVGQ